jgi:hypothetical protein
MEFPKNEADIKIRTIYPGLSEEELLIARDKLNRESGRSGVATRKISGATATSARKMYAMRECMLKHDIG